MAKNPAWTTSAASSARRAARSRPARAALVAVTIGTLVAARTNARTSGTVTGGGAIPGGHLQDVVGQSGADGRGRRLVALLEHELSALELPPVPGPVLCVPVRIRARHRRDDREVVVRGRRGRSPLERAAVERVRARRG